MAIFTTKYEVGDMVLLRGETDAREILDFDIDKNGVTYTVSNRDGTGFEYAGEGHIIALVASDDDECECCCDDCGRDGFEEDKVNEPSYNPLDYQKVTIEYFIKK